MWTNFRHSWEFAGPSRSNIRPRWEFRGHAFPEQQGTSSMKLVMVNNPDYSWGVQNKILVAVLQTDYTGVSEWFSSPPPPPPPHTHTPLPAAFVLPHPTPIHIFCQEMNTNIFNYQLKEIHMSFMVHLLFLPLWAHPDLWWWELKGTKRKMPVLHIVLLINNQYNMQWNKRGKIG